MSRIKELRKVVGSKLRESITDVEKLESAYVHLYGVSLAATVIAEKRGEDSELASMAAMLHDIAAYVNGTYDDHAHRGADMAKEILLRNALAKPKEIDIICSAIYHHDDKLVRDEPLAEVLKDADVMHHTFNDLAKPVKEKELARYLALRQEFGLPVQE
ncbi:MAG: HD domain-containing protein [Selenomonas sp.]|jgi:putative nucleotidyltransferase with HDIG domain|nr:HD domain-containing protein [Selenomonas sp.]